MEGTRASLSSQWNSAREARERCDRWEANHLYLHRPPRKHSPVVEPGHKSRCRRWRRVKIRRELRRHAPEKGECPVRASYRSMPSSPLFESKADLHLEEAAPVRRKGPKRKAEKCQISRGAVDGKVS